jgi:hypothetical protein
MRIASFNIEKNGKSSDDGKQKIVSDFIDRCCNPNHWNVDVLFLCEVHAALQHQAQTSYFYLSWLIVHIGL